MTELLIALVSLLSATVVAFIAAYGLNKTSKRINSGNITTSNATDMWEEGKALRLENREDLKEAREQIKVLSDKLDASNGKLDVAITRITELLREVELSHAVADRAREDMVQSRAETALSRAETAKLLVAVSAVHTEVTTGNAQSMAILADNAESRRIALIPLADRTHVERDHIDTVGITDGKPRDKDKQPENDT